MYIFLFNNIFLITIIKLLYFSQQWILDKQDLIRERQLDLQVLSEDEYQKICIFFTNCK